MLGVPVSGGMHLKSTGLGFAASAGLTRAGSSVGTQELRVCGVHSCQ